MISDYAANDGAPKQEPIISPERTAVPPDLLLDLVGDHLRGASTKLDHLSPVKITCGPLGATGPELL
jgi:hypothetical protein